MANQPKKYKKFVATAATATLVASAIVPVASAASFTDVADNTHAEAINALVDAGIINGYPDGTFKPNATLTRGHVVKMLGKWVEAQGFEVPADWNTVERFTDLAVDAADQELVKYAAVVKDSGVFNGSNGALMASGSMTRENMALVLDRAYKAIFGQSLVEEAADLEDLTVADLSTAREETREAIQALRNLGISVVDNYNPKGTVTRGQFASFLNRTINVEGETPEPPAEVVEVEIASVKTTGATQLTVEFNKAVDTNAAKFELKRGNAVVAIKDVDFNEAGTVAVIELENRFAAATYNLTVTGVSEKALTSSVTTTQETAAEVKFNSNKLILTGQKDADGNVLATITFDVYNQYGEIITDSVPTSKYKKPNLKGIKSEDPEIKEKGILTVWIDEGEDDGEIGTLEFTYEDGDLEIDVVQEVELSDEIEAGEVTIKGVHSKAGYDFTAANVEKVADDNADLKNGEPTDDFVLLFEVKDQFGAAINPDKVFEGTQDDFEDAPASTANVKITSLEQIVDGLRFDVSNKDIFDIEGDLENVEILNVDGKYYFAAYLSFELDGKYLEETGENTVTIRSKATGNEASSKITLADSTKIHSVTLSSPTDTVAGNEDVYIPVEVKDQDGEKIVNVARLNELERDGEIIVDYKGPAVTDRHTFVERNGEVFLKLKTTTVTDEDGKDLEVSIEVETSGEESEIEFTVEENAYAERIARVNGSKAVYYDRNQAIGIDDLVIEDQYGRVFDDESDYKVKVTVKDPSKFTIAGGATGELNFTGTDEIRLVPNGNANNLGSSSVEFELITDDESVSKLNVTYRLVDEDNFTSYKVEGTDLIKGTNDGTYDAADELQHAVKVFGITGSGEKVRLPGKAFSVLSTPYLTTTSQDSANVFATADAEDDLYSVSGTNTLETSYTVIISKTGEAIKRDVKVTDAKRVVAKLGFEDKGSVAGNALTSTEFEFTASQLNGTITGEALINELLADADVTIADQFGFDEGDDIKLHVTSSGAAVTFGGKDQAGVAITLSNISNEDVKVTNNGRSDNLTVTGLEENDSFALTLTVNGVSQSVLVHVIED